MLGAIEQVVLVGGHWRKAIRERGIDKDVTRGARCTASAKCENLIQACVANYLHEGQPFLDFQVVFVAVPSSNVEEAH
jgi:hypothetical protein